MSANDGIDNFGELTPEELEACLADRLSAGAELDDPEVQALARAAGLDDEELVELASLADTLEFAGAVSRAGEAVSASSDEALVTAALERAARESSAPEETDSSTGDAGRVLLGPGASERRATPGVSWRPLAAAAAAILAVGALLWGGGPGGSDDPGPGPGGNGPSLGGPVDGALVVRMEDAPVRLGLLDLPEDLVGLRNYLTVRVERREDPERWTLEYEGPLPDEGYLLEQARSVIRWRAWIQAPGDAREKFWQDWSYWPH